MKQTKPHKWAEAIKAWAEGRPIQFRLNDETKWIDFCLETSHVPTFSVHEWRVKPQSEKVKYRRYLYESRVGPMVNALNQCDPASDPASYPSFIRWIDSDWITEEVEL